MMQSPAKILKLWHKINDRYGPEEDKGDKKDTKKKVSEKEKAAGKQNEKIAKGLTVLRNVASAGIKAPREVKRFEKVRGKVVRVMQVYCKNIKGLKLEGAADMTKFRKSVRQLTIVVMNLNPQLVDTTEAGDADLKDILAVDDTALDQKLEDPTLGEADDVSFAEDEEAENETAEATGARPAADNDQQGQYEELATRVARDLQQLRPLNPTQAEVGEKMAALAASHAQKQDFRKAKTVLEGAAASVTQALTAAQTKPATAPPTGVVAAAVLKNELQQVRLQATQGVGQLESLLRGTGDTRARQVANIVNQLVAGFPMEMEALLDRLNAAVQARDTNAAQQLRAEVQKAAQGWLAYLQTHADHIDGCEKNPFGIQVQIAAPIKKSLTAILKVTR